jgi:hypothetical protein
MLILKDCTALEELPQTIGKLSRLKNLDLHGCSALKALPDSVGELVELTQLSLSYCTTLERLPDTICLLSKLEKLWLVNCTELEFLPIEFGKLQRLDEFWADATSLSRLPHSFSQLSNLEDLHLDKCEKIQELPSMSGLVKLKLFHMGHIGVQTLPEDFGRLQNLVELHLYGCKNLQTLPQSFGSLQLPRLRMHDNPKLEMLPEVFGRHKSLSPVQQQDDWPSLKAIQQPLDMGSLEGSNRNFAGSTSEELTIQVLQQRAQQQGEGSPVNLPQATRILKILSSDVNLGQADLMPNVVGAIPSTAIGLSNVCHSDRETWQLLIIFKCFRFSDMVLNC